MVPCLSSSTFQTPWTRESGVPAGRSGSITRDGHSGIARTRSGPTAGPADPQKYLPGRRQARPTRRRDESSRLPSRCGPIRRAWRQPGRSRRRSRPASARCCRPALPVGSEVLICPGFPRRASPPLVPTQRSAFPVTPDVPDHVRWQALILLPGFPDSPLNPSRHATADQTQPH